ncbi:MAG: alpha/beta hydrolase [Treponemataceae bacterium]|nr:alpha/beta hydrolase [Treponemataceae bacterium]
MKFRNSTLLFFIFLIFSLFSCNSSYDSTFDFEILRADCADSVDLYNDGSYIVANPKAGTDKAIIFYPGGLVSYQAYLPLMIKCAKNGICTFIVPMPSDFAILKMYAAERIQHRYNEINDWYLCGHSLGGAMASSYINSHADQYKGLILLAAYSTKDLTDTDLKVLSIYGSKDGVLNFENYNKYRPNIITDSFTEIIIEGGNHAQFGNYGKQEGDNDADISADAQQEESAQAIALFCSD